MRAYRGLQVSSGAHYPPPGGSDSLVIGLMILTDRSYWETVSYSATSLCSVATSVKRELHASYPKVCSENLEANVLLVNRRTRSDNQGEDRLP